MYKRMPFAMMLQQAFSLPVTPHTHNARHTRGYGQRYIAPYSQKSRIDRHQTSFHSATIRLWNVLPDALVPATSTAAFRTGIQPQPERNRLFLSAILRPPLLSTFTFMYCTYYSLYTYNPSSIHSILCKTIMWNCTSVSTEEKKKVVY